MADGTVTIEVELTKEQLEKGLKSLKTDLNSLEKATSGISSKLSKGLSSIGSVATKAGTALTVGLTTPLIALGTAGVKYNAQMEDFEANLTTLLGSADKAKDMLNDLKEMANTTPFETSDLLEATQMMLGFGLAADKTQGYLQTLGDISMGNSEKLMSLTRAFSQIGAAGKATMEDINQMIDAGFNPLQIMSEKTGKSMADLREEVSDGKISFEDIAEAMEDATSEGGRYYKAMEKASKTMNGKLSTALDALKTALGNLTQSLLPIVTKVVEKITEWANAFANLDQETQQTILTIAGVAMAIGPVLTVVGKLSTRIGTVTKGLGTFSQAIALVGKTSTESFDKASKGTQTLAKALTALKSPAGLLALTITGVTLAASAMYSEMNKSGEAVAKSSQEIEKAKNEYISFNQEQDNVMNTTMSEIDNTQKLVNELNTLVDENGKVKEGYEDRVSYILNELNGALGTEYKMTGNVISNYKELTDTIDNLLLKERAQAILENDEAKRNEALDKKNQAYEDMISKTQELSDAQNELNKRQKEYEDFANSYSGKLAPNVVNNMKMLVEQQQYAVDQAQKNLDSSKEIYNGYLNDIATYENDYTTILSGNNEKIQEMITQRTYAYQNGSTDIGETINKSIQQVQYEIQQYQQAYNQDLQNQDNYNAQKNQIQIEAGQKQLETLAQQLVAMTSTTEEMTPQQIEAWKALASGSFETYSEYVSKLAPEMQTKIQEATGVVIASTPEFAKRAGEMGQQVAENFDKNNEAKQSALNDLQGFYEGLNNEEKKQLLQQTVGERADEVAKEFENGDYETSGKNVLQGLYDGLSNGTLGQNLISKAAGIAKRIANQFNIQWDEHSPSKLMKKKAEYFLQPIDTVFSKREAGLIRNASNLAKGITKGFDKSFALNNVGGLYSKMKSAVDFETQKLSASLSTTATTNKTLTANITVNPSDIYMDSTKVGRVVAPAVTKTLRGAGAY